MRLFITGIGLVTSLGIGVETTWARLVRGERGIRPVELFSTEGYRARLGAEVVGLSDSPPAPGAWSRTARMAHEAAREALAWAGLPNAAAPGGTSKRRLGLVVAGSTGGMFENEQTLAAIHADPSTYRAEAEPGSLLAHPLWATTDRLNETFGPFVRVRTISSACSGGANALIVAASWILSGEVDTVLAGGTDGLCRLTFSGFNALAAIDPEMCRPFDVRRRGLNLGEGAGFLVLERDDVARARGSTPLVELGGWSIGAEAHHITNPEQTGTTAGRVIRGAVARAGLSAEHIDYVNAHGTGTPLNDPMESAAIALALGPENLARVPVSSSKGQIGHTLAAAGAIEAAITALVIARQTVVPTAGLGEVDPVCARLTHVLGEGCAARVRAAVTNAFGFGGMDSALVLTEPELGPEHAPRRRSVVVTAAATFTPAGLLGTHDSTRVLAPVEANVLPQLDPLLDLDRARRLDRLSRMGAVVVGRAIADAFGAGSLPASGGAPVGAVLGTNFGSIDASASFIHRVLSKGPRAASPAEFPNLVQSSPSGHVSIYLGLRGPVLAAVELGTTGECAVMQAAELVALGEADAMAAGDVEEANGVLEKIFVALFARTSAEGSVKRGEGGGAVVLEAEDAVRARGGVPLARIAHIASWHDDQILAELPPPLDPGGAVVVFPRPSPDVATALAKTAWAGVSQQACAGSGGDHEALGAIAIAAAVSRLSRREVREALVIGRAKGRGYAFVLVAP